MKGEKESSSSALVLKSNKSEAVGCTVIFLGGGGTKKSFKSPDKAEKTFIKNPIYQNKIV